MKFAIIIFFLSVMLLGCSTSHSVVSSLDPVSQLRADINSVLSDSLFIPTHAAIKVVALEDNTVLYERDSKVLMHPASNMKLFTSAAALSILDTNYLLKTSVFIDRYPSDSLVNGALYLKGYGNPDFTDADADSLAAAVRRFGITTIAGDLILDNSYFDDEYWGAGWTWDDESDPDAPYIDALSINKNCITIIVTSDSMNISAYTEPMTDFVTITMKATIAIDSIRNPLKIKCLLMNNPNTIVIEGELPKFSYMTQKVSLRRPEYYTGTLFRESLKRAGILVNGNLVDGLVPKTVPEIACHIQPIEKVITAMNKVSDNLAAENLIKIIGAEKYGIPGTTRHGLTMVKLFLSEAGIDTVQCSVADGSGVSRYNLFSADQIVQFLTALYKQPKIFSILYHSLPIAGIDGTLSERMVSYPASTNLHAKTGTLNGVSCLSGYVQTRDGEMLTFSILMQNFNTSPAAYRRAQDRIGGMLAGFSRNSLVNKIKTIDPYHSLKK